MNRITFNLSSKLKVLAINGSHRKGNTQFMLRTIKNQINKTHPQNQAILINLTQKNIQYCTVEDYQCKQTSNCTCCRDDMTHIYPLMQSADILIFGSPIYFYSVTGRMKTFIDRCNGYVWNRKLMDKKAFIIAVGGSTIQNQMVNSLTQFFKALRIIPIGGYFAKAEKANDIQNNQKVINQLKQLVNLKLLLSAEPSKATNSV